MTDKRWREVELENVAPGDTVRVSLSEGHDSKLVLTGRTSQGAFDRDVLVVNFPFPFDDDFNLSAADSIERLEPVMPPLPTKPGEVVIVDSANAYIINALQLPAAGVKGNDGYWNIDGIFARPADIKAWRPAVIAPTEPSETMIEAGAESITDALSRDGKNLEWDSKAWDVYRYEARKVYRAMIQKAQK